MSTPPNSESAPVVTPSSYLTLHYRLSTKNKTEIISTFNENPATLQLGMGQLAPALEQQLIGLTEGAHHVVALPPEQAFGLRNPDLIQPVSRATLQENSALNEKYEVGDSVEFAAPSGGRFAGVLKSMGTESAVFDFNHPLAGQELIFEVRIIGIL
jgi:FKBP-type peptidyl-prolyl cis-trans isomerase SlpA